MSLSQFCATALINTDFVIKKFGNALRFHELGDVQICLSVILGCEMEIHVDRGFCPLVVVYNPSPPDIIAWHQKSQEFHDRPVSFVGFCVDENMLSEDVQEKFQKLIVVRKILVDYMPHPRPTMELDNFCLTVLYSGHIQRESRCANILLISVLVPSTESELHQYCDILAPSLRLVLW